MKKILDFERRVLIFRAADGTEQEFNPFDERVSEETRLHGLLHGFSQKIGDSYSSAADEPDPEAYARNQVKANIEQLYANSWRATSGKVSALVRAFAQVSGVSLEEAGEFVGALDETEQKALKKQTKIKLVLEEIAAEAKMRKIAALRAQAAAEDAAKEAAAA